MSRQNKKIQNKFQELGGIDTLERFKSIAEDSTSGMENIYRSLKNYYLFRELKKIHIDVTPHIDVLSEEDPDYILDVYEKALDDLAINVRGINSPENIGDGACAFIDSLELRPDVGMDLPFPIINGLTRGLRKRSLIAIGAHTNVGKSRYVSKIADYISVKHAEKSLIISTEMTKGEMTLQMVTDIANDQFLGEDDKIEERDIAVYNITPVQKEGIKKAAAYLEKHSNIDFICTNVYDIKTLERMIKRAAIMGTDYIFIDVLKPMRAESAKSDMAEWQMYTMTAERLKQLAINLGLCIIVTMQLKSGTEKERDLTYSHISIGSHIAHVLDVCLLFRDISYEEKTECGFRDPDTKQTYPLDGSSRYMTCKIAKNRAGQAGQQIVLKVRKGHMEFEEQGFLTQNLTNVII